MSRTCVVIAPVDAYIGASDIVLEVHADPGDVTLEKTVRFLGPNPQSTQNPKPLNPHENHRRIPVPQSLDLCRPRLRPAIGAWSTLISIAVKHSRSRSR